MEKCAWFCAISVMIMFSCRTSTVAAPLFRNVRQATWTPCPEYIANPDWSFNPQSWSRYDRNRVLPEKPCLSIDEQKQMPVDEINSNAAIAYGMMGAGLMQAGVPGR